MIRPASGLGEVVSYEKFYVADDFVNTKLSISRPLFGIYLLLMIQAMHIFFYDI